MSKVNNKKKVMIVDDAGFTRAMLKNIINDTKYAEVVGEAKNGNEAINLYKKLKPDMVTMDLIMPEMGGLEAIKNIMKIDKKAFIIVVSAIGQQELILEATKIGAKDFIRKPFKKEQVMEIIERHIMATS
ncbi:MAG: response regulator [Promethearchaeota archaeon]|nr:MAG: response regulator [Candidatus Lokiarchaeota archaeon]